MPSKIPKPKKEKKKRSLIPKNGNDKVYTPDYLAKQIIDHYNPCGYVLEPFRGKGAFSNQFSADCACDWCEIDDGRDYFTYNVTRYNYVVTNPPWSLFRPSLVKSMECADNVIFLCLINAFFMNARMRDMEEHKFGIREILHIVKPPPKPWPQTGLALGAVHVQKNWTGDIKWSKLI